MITDLLVGGATTGLIIHLARPASSGALLGLLQSHVAVGVGSFSYSLYLIHFPILAMCGAVVSSWGWGVEVRLALMVVAAPLVCVLAAYVFHLIFERRPAITSRGGGACPWHGRRSRRRRGRPGLAPWPPA
jgi:peptidoglycan/LPS O-acetylase OafA/YrhL